MWGNCMEYTKFELSKLKLYQKKKSTCHFVRSLNVKSAGEQITIHTLEGDVTVTADDDMYIMIGAYEDIYPIPKDTFESKYLVIPGMQPLIDDEVLDANGIDRSKIECCRLVTDSYVYARKMDKDFKVYTKHCDSVLSGKAGDYYVVSREDRENVYIIRGDIMEETYEEITTE